MARQSHSPYTSRYKKSVMSSPQQPRNPFRRRTRSISTTGKNGILPRYAVFQDCHFLAKAFKQACVIIVAGTILVSLLSAAIPPAPLTTSRMAAPRPPQVVASGTGTFRANTAAIPRKGGGVRSQSKVRTNVKKPKNNRQSSLHWDAETLGHDDGDGEHPNFNEVTSSDESPSKQHAAQQLAAEIESKTIKENAAADGVFGRTNDGEVAVVAKEGGKKKATKTVPKGRVNVDAIDSSGDKEKANQSDKSKSDEGTPSDGNGQDTEATAGEDDETNEDVKHKTRNVEDQLGKVSAKLVDLKLEDKSVDDTSEGDAETEKNGAFGKDDATNEKEILKVEPNSNGDTDKEVADDESSKNATGDSNTDENMSDSKGDVDGSSKEKAEQVDASRKDDETDVGEADVSTKTNDDATTSQDESKAMGSDSHDNDEGKPGHSDAANKANDARKSKADPSGSKEQQGASKRTDDSKANGSKTKAVLDEEMADRKRIAQEKETR